MTLATEVRAPRLELLANDRLRSVLGHEPHTPLDEAVDATLRGLGCLPDEVQPRLAHPFGHKKAPTGGAF